MLFRPIPLSISFGCLGEGQRIQIGTVGQTPVFIKKTCGGWIAELGDIAGLDLKILEAAPAKVERLALYLQKNHPEIKL